jgi:hypothetical protein
VRHVQVHAAAAGNEAVTLQRILIVRIGTLS